MEEPTSLVGIFGSIILLVVTFVLTNFVKPWADRRNGVAKKDEDPSPPPIVGEPIMESSEEMWRRIHNDTVHELDEVRAKLARCQARCSTYQMILKYHGLAALEEDEAGHTDADS